MFYPVELNDVEKSAIILFFINLVNEKALECLILMDFSIA